MFFYTVMGITMATKYKKYIMMHYSLKRILTNAHRTMKKMYFCFRLELISVKLTSSYKLHKFLLYFFYKSVIIFYEQAYFSLHFLWGIVCHC